MYTIVIPALQAWSRGYIHQGSGLVKVSLDLAALDLCLVDLVLHLVLLVPPPKPRGQGWGLRGVLDVSGNVVDGHLDRALVPRAAEPGDDFLLAAGDWGRTALLQADDIPSEAEAEVARVVSGDLLSRHKYLPFEQTSSWSKVLKVNIFIIISG